jgi:hypothetical protein
MINDVPNPYHILPMHLLLKGKSRFSCQNCMLEAHGVNGKLKFPCLGVSFRDLAICQIELYIFKFIQL